MQKLTLIAVVILNIFILSAISCKNDEDTPTNPIDQLPPATQTGANTIGCLVNGEVLLPKGSPLAGPVKSAFYQLIDGDYFFGLSLNYRNGNERKGLTIELKRIELSENSVIILDKNRVVDRDDDGGFGYYYFTPDWMDTSLGNEYYNTSNVSGEIIITNLNESQQIISGTFWFDAINEEGEVVEIREGRFDWNY